MQKILKMLRNIKSVNKQKTWSLNTLRASVIIRNSF